MLHELHIQQSVYTFKFYTHISGYTFNFIHSGINHWLN